MSPENDKETTSDHFFTPLREAMERIPTRKCGKVSDFEYMKRITLRAIMSVKSGRDFVQKMMMMMENAQMSVSLFFHSLASPRRQEMVSQAAEQLCKIVNQKVLSTDGADPLKQIPELDGFAVYATDGHTHAASAHEKERHGKTYPTTSIFSLNMRTMTLRHAILLQPEENMKKEHEIKALKRMDIEALRMGEPKGVKVIHVYDPAIIDYGQWYRWKQGSGIYVITREKSNSALSEIKSNDWNKCDKRNRGVVSDSTVLSDKGYTLRRVTYRDPESGNLFNFLTNEMTLPPGIIAFLYRLRWDVEKVFDQTKNTTDEKKSWAANPEAKIQQAQAVVTAHNLMIYMEHELKYVHRIDDNKVKAKTKTRIEAAKEKAEHQNRSFNPLVDLCQRATKRSLQFVRWLRHGLEHGTLWSKAVATVEPFMNIYLQ